MSEPKWRYINGRMHKLLNRTHEDYEHEYNFNQTHIEKAELKSKLIDFINELSADEPCPCDLHTFSDETLIDFLRDLIKEKGQLAADAELDACCEWLNTGHYDFSCAGNNLISRLKQNRRPKPTLKSQALRDFETVKKLNPDMLPEILGTIEKALKSIPE